MRTTAQAAIGSAPQWAPPKLPSIQNITVRAASPRGSMKTIRLMMA